LEANGQYKGRATGFKSTFFNFTIKL